MLDLYLRELERELSRKLSHADTATLLFEMRDHLEQSIQARLELGSSREQAEREALATFGGRETLVARLPDPTRGRPLAFRLSGLTAATLAITASVTLFALTDWAWVAMAPLLAVALLAAWSLVLGFHARRPAPVPLFLGGVVASLAFTIFAGAAFLNLGPYGGSTGVVRWKARQTVAESLAKPGRTWTTRDALGRSMTYREAAPFSESDLAAIPRAEADPLGNAFSQAGEAFSSGMALGCVAGAFDLIGAGLGWLWIQRRSRRPTVA